MNGQNAYAYLNNNPFAAKNIEYSQNKSQVNSLNGSLNSLGTLDEDSIQDKKSPKSKVSRLRSQELKLRKKIIAAKSRGNTDEVKQLEEQLDKVKEKLQKTKEEANKSQDL